MRRVRRPTPRTPPIADEKVDLVLWHWQDKRLQSQQEVQEAARPLVQLPGRVPRAAEEVHPARRRGRAHGERRAEGAMGDRHRRPRVRAHGQPRRPALPGRLRRSTWRPASASSRSSACAGSTARRPTASRSSTTRTATTTSTRWRPGRRATSPRACRRRSSTPKTTTTSSSRRPASIGWTSDSASVLLTDNWDIWQVPVDGGTAVNLTVNGRKDAIRYQHRFALEPPQERDKASTSRSRSTSRAYGEWTKKAGIARLEPGQARRADADWGDAAFGRLIKAQGRRRFIYTRATGDRAGRLLRHRRELRARATRLTDSGRRSAAYTWTAGIDARQLHERQGRQAAGGAVPAGRLREGQGVSDDRQHLREAVADREHVRESDARTASTARSTPATATRC